MSRRPDPARIDEARRAGNRNRLMGEGVTESTADAWIPAWEKTYGGMSADRAEAWLARWEADEVPDARQRLLGRRVGLDHRRRRAGGAAVEGLSSDGRPAASCGIVQPRKAGGVRASGYAFDPIYQYDATTYRTSSTSTTFTGHINGASLLQSGFGLSDNIKGYAWGEATGGSACPSANSGSFIDWEKYDTSVGWTYVTSSTVYRYSSGMSGAPCWNTITSTGSKGNFNVHD